jgi:hypothetical protein
VPVGVSKRASVAHCAVSRLSKAIESLERDLSTWKLLAVLFGGALFGLVVIFGDYPWWDERHRKFASNGAFNLWVGLICAQTAVWTLALAWLISTVGRLRADYCDENRAEVNSSTRLLFGITAFLMVGPLTNPWPDYVPHHAFKNALLTIVGMLVGLVAAVYLPAQLTLARVGNSIRDEIFPALPPTSPEWRDRTEERDRLGNVLDLEVGPLGRFRASVAILTPLVGSFVGLLLK